MKNLSKVAFGALILAMFVGCGEDAKFGDKEYTHDYLNDKSNVKILVELVEFCEANKSANLNTIQMKNCELGDFIKHKKIKIGVCLPVAMSRLNGKNS
ncbi:hypothetical protein [Campylobacter hyointestinalis]|uniref:hypothetical protein n=1 Tax=Campylobacter hyointestinalis TaxID=198 RepID=UPI001BD58672|nr:hypothetical protein [Campylobacter hyointestinalis]MBT0612821.1 hypothetical protein [Campylobacter hyointestinalis subsp. hyointestinalis]MDY2999655.1 hypothetical protein [Campylobacter hyointestinalis]